MIKVTTDEGVTGYGEAAPLAFVTAETTDSVIAALELFRTGLIGMDPLDIEAVHAMMDGLMGGNSSAKCAVDLAMYDIRGKAAGMPVYKLLGGYSNTVLNDITVSIMEPQAMADKALSYVRDKGYTANLTEVLAVAVPDVPGGLAGVLKLLRDNDISVEYLYSFVRRVGNDASSSSASTSPSARGTFCATRACACSSRTRSPDPAQLYSSALHKLHNRRRFPAQKRGEPPLLSACARNCMKLSKKILANRFRDHYNNTVRSRAGVAIRSHRKGKVT